MVSRIGVGLVFIFSFLLFGCINKEKKDKEEQLVFSSEIYDKEKFADIIFDLTLVESVYRLNMANEESVISRNEIYKDVLKNHETDSTIFDENWTYYGYRPDEMQEVYELVLAKIDTLRVARGAQVAKKRDDE